MTFDGRTFNERRDGARLRRKLDIVRRVMADGQPHTLRELARAAKCSTAGASARVRDLRKARYGGRCVLRSHVGRGVWVYRLAGKRVRL